MNEIICGDALTEMKKMKSESVDLIITSPPYNLRNSTGGWANGKKGKSSRWSNADMVEGYDNYDDNIPMEEYNEWQHECLEEMLRLIPENGAIFYNHKWRVQNGIIQDRHEILQGLPVRQIIIWQRAGGINFNDGYFVPTYEVIYMIAKPGFKLVPQMNKWGDVWRFNQDSDNDHPAPFPIDLPERIILSTDAKTVFDPFVGSGTTCVAAKKLGREYLGVDISPKYCEMARDRLDKTVRRIKLDAYVE